MGTWEGSWDGRCQPIPIPLHSLPRRRVPISWQDLDDDFSSFTPFPGKLCPPGWQWLWWRQFPYPPAPGQASESSVLFLWQAVWHNRKLCCLQQVDPSLRNGDAGPGQCVSPGLLRLSALQPEVSAGPVADPTYSPDPSLRPAGWECCGGGMQT